MTRATFTFVIGPQKGQRAEFEAARISVGRAPDNMLCLGDGARRVSAHHAEVIQRGGQYVLRDLGSTNGTSINGRRIVVSELEPDDLLEFGAGGPLLRFSIEGYATKCEPHSGDAPQTESSHVDSNAIAPMGSKPRAAGGVKKNARLVAALVAAMMLGGLGGIVASSRLRASDPAAMSFAEVAELNSRAVVFIRAEFELLDSTSRVITTEARTGSGFIVAESGLIITNRHLVRDWEYNKPPDGTTGRITNIQVVLPHQKPEDSVQAEIYKLGADSSVDVAVLKIADTGAPAVHAIEPDINATNQGDEVVVIGYPLGLDLLERTNDNRIDPSLSTGIVSRIGRDFIQLDLRAYHGNSGGPVLNRRGEVIGILTASVSSAQDIALSTPISAALLLLKDELSYRIGSRKGVPPRAPLAAQELLEPKRGTPSEGRPYRFF
jgi:serine protease Do